MRLMTREKCISKACVLSGNWQHLVENMIGNMCSSQIHVSLAPFTGPSSAHRRRADEGTGVYTHETRTVV